MEPSNVRNVDMENSDVNTGVTEADTTRSNAGPTQHVQETQLSGSYSPGNRKRRAEP